MKILQVISTLDPSYGGPVESLRQSILAFEKLGHHVEVVTLDVEDVEWVHRFPGRVHTVGPGFGKYGFNSKLLKWLRANSVRFDTIIVRGIWQFHSLAVWIVSRELRIRYFVFVHGALDPWFKYQYPLKHLKKWLYWPWAEYRVLRDAAAVLYTSEEEKRLARDSFWLYKTNELVVNYGVLAPQGSPESQCQVFVNAFPLLRGKRIILYLGRIHPKKGCDILIEAFARVSEKDPDLHLVFAGPDRDGWQSSLEDIAGNLGINHRFTWTGMLEGDLKWGAFYASEAFVLPSHSENFGVAVVEALACGLPVLITNKVNIWREINDTGCGFVDEDSLEGVTRLLDRWLNLLPPARIDMKRKARIAFETYFELEKGTEKFVETIKRFL